MSVDGRKISISDEHLQRIGREVTRGALGHVFKMIWWVAIAILLTTWAINYFGLSPADDCDKSVWERCGVKIVTDHKTGVQYLVTPDGGIILREQRKP